MKSEHEVIRAMFEARQEKDMKELRKNNEELRVMVTRSANTLQGKFNVNTSTPPSAQAQ